jgi:uncharacterized protein YpmB
MTHEEYALEISPRWWQRSVAAIGSIERLLVELITNSTDSYKRLQPHKVTSIGKIEIRYFPSEKGTEIQVKDEAEGISLERFRKALEYGEDTSGLSRGLPVRGTLGIGLKDVCIAMQGSRILSIHNNFLNECTIFRKDGKPWVRFLRKNQIVSNEERKELNLKGNGTIVTGFVLKESLPILDFKTLYKNLCKHFMLRMINQSTRYNVILKGNRKEEDCIIYVPPEGESLLEKVYDIPYESSSYRVKVVIKKAVKSLVQTGEFRDGGLVIIYNEDAVADCSLFGFDSDPYAKKLFGKIEIERFSKLLLDQTKSIVDERRRGLDKRHKFVQDLTILIGQDLEKIIEKERKAEMIQRQSIIKSKENLNRVLRELNTIVRSELKEIGELDTLPPDWRHPDFFRFYHDNLEVLEFMPSTVGLGINSDRVPHQTKIEISSNEPKVEISPPIIVVDHSKAKGMLPLIREKVVILGKKAGIQAQITAKIGDTIPSAKIMVNVQENPLLNPIEGFAFIPNEITISEKWTKYANLLIDLKLINRKEANKIQFSTSNSNIYCPQQIGILPKLNTIGDKVAQLQVHIKGKGVGQTAIITASYRSKQTNLRVTVTERERQSRGLFRGFDYVDWDPGVELISDYDPKTGFILVNKTHPSFRKHQNISWSALKIFVIDIITKKVCEKITNEKVVKGVFPSFSDNPGTFMTEVFLDIEHLYHKYAHRLYDLLANYLKKPR